MDPDPDLEDALRKAVDLIVKSQSPSGGWRYNPTPRRPGPERHRDADRRPPRGEQRRGPRPREGDREGDRLRPVLLARQPAATPTRPAAGPARRRPPPASSRSSCSASTTTRASPRPSKHSASTRSSGTRASPTSTTSTTTRSRRATRPAASTGTTGTRKVRELLLSKQNADGSWDVPPGTAEASEGVVGPNKVYWTAMASLILEIYMHYLPAYQR